MDEKYLNTLAKVFILFEINPVNKNLFEPTPLILDLYKLHKFTIVPK